MPVLTLSIGSNIDAANKIRQAVRALRAEYDNILCSTVYESVAIGFEADNFLNLVAVIQTDTALTSIVSFLKRLEDQLGRDRTQPKPSSRTMDIDILTYGSETGAESGVVLPRPEIIRNAFVLRPLAELLPQQVHSGTAECFSRLWADYDKASQRLWPTEFDWQDILE
ncbi:MAG: 2-amino-4-hydroxy-6-hydroxymethyldihydropteridine diphosphokinase [Proteobacteria bacterium]|nr:2-amino-4-hydroxy-6-hydroxymethyldihydropteridine diphosphokinase [Pseudomonadota bacterium]